MPNPVTIREIRDELDRLLYQVSGVGGVAVAWDSSGGRCLRVSVDAGFARPDQIPDTFRGIPVTVQTAGLGHFSGTRSDANR